MQLLDRSTPSAIVNDAAAQKISGVNQKTYARLKMSLRLNLRRQIFLAVCDDLELRNHLVANLQAELAPRFVSLNLNLSDPNPMAQVTQWLAQRGQAIEYDQPAPAIGFQVLGVEHLTRQPASVQRQFLTHLQAIEYYLPALECTVLLWLPRPWLRSVRQSAPTFWDWHTALFEFEGDPTPVRSFFSPSLVSSPKIEHRDSQIAIAPPAPQATPTWLNGCHIQPLSGKPTDQVIIPIELDDNAFLRHTVEEKSLWEVLTQDSDLVKPDADSASMLEPPDGISSSQVPAPPQVSETVSLIQPVVAPPEQPDVIRCEQPIPAGVSQLQRLILEAIAEDDSATHRTGWQQVQQIEQLHQQGAPQQVLAASYYALARRYRESLEQGDVSGHTLAIAIAAHQETLAWLEHHAALGADVANDLGNLYWMQSRSAVEADGQLASLEQAIQAYHLALTKSDPQTTPQTYAMIQNNLGSAYGDLAQYREPAENLQKSVLAYETALRYRTYEDDPARYAATQNNLGTACWNLAQHQQPVPCLQQAIAAYQSALQFYTPEQEPMAYAMIQNNLGTAYWNLAQYIKPSRTQNRTDSEESPEHLLQLAIAAYHNALTYRTLEAAPDAFAATQNNLGTAYWDCSNLPATSPEQRRKLVQQAISAYEAAIAAVDQLSAQNGHRLPLTFDVFATYNNLGLSYYQLACDRHTNLKPTQRLSYLEKALDHHLQALQGWEAQSDFHQLTLGYVVQTLRGFYTECGIQGQTVGLSKIPAQLLPEIMAKL
jgi:tetratricopeptide (TPR) repeat protein